MSSLRETDEEFLHLRDIGNPFYSAQDSHIRSNLKKSEPTELYLKNSNNHPN